VHSAVKKKDCYGKGKRKEGKRRTTSGKER
jgi:hypothetical protein